MYNRYNLERNLVLITIFFALGIASANVSFLFSLMIFIFCLAIILWRGQKQLVIYTIAFLLAVMMIWWLSLPNKLLANYQGEITIYGEVKSQVGEYYTLVEVDYIGDEALALKPKIAVSKAYEDEQEYPLGAYVTFVGELYQPSEESNPGGFSSKSYWQTQGVFWLFDADDIGTVLAEPGQGNRFVSSLRLAINEILENNMPPESYNITQALLFGDKNALDDEFYAMSQKMGIAHVFAVSGLHVGFVVGFVFFLFRIVKKDDSWLCFWSLVFVVLVYCALSGFTVSANRAAIMAILTFLARKRLRYKDFYSILAAAALVTLVSNPYALYAVGAQLSYGVTWSLVFFLPLFTRLLAPLKSKWLINSLAVVLAAQIMSIPLCAWYFYNISLFSLLFNLIIVPIIGIIVPLILFSLMIAALIPALGKIFFAASSLMLQGVESFLTIFADLFGTGHRYVGQPSIIILVLFVAVFVLWRYDVGKKLGKKRNLLYLGSALILLVLIILPPKAYDRVTFLDVGQGSGAVVQTADGECLVMDCGRSSDTVASYLRYLGINKVDKIILSHADWDHIAGLGNILRDFKVGEVIATEESWQNEWLAEMDQAGAFAKTKKVIATEDEQNIGDLKLSLYPLPESENLFAWVDLDGTTFGFSGDITSEEQLLVTMKYSQIDVWTVPHHGSKSNMVYGFYRRTEVKLAVISVGRHNYYGHPNYAVLEDLYKNHIPYLRTDTKGAISVYPTEEGFRVEKFWQ